MGASMDYQRQPAETGVVARDYYSLTSDKVWHVFAIGGLGISFLASLYCGFFSKMLPDFSAWTCSGFILIALLSAILITPRIFCIGFLVTLLFQITAWRIAALNQVLAVEIVAGVTFILLLLQFLRCVQKDCQLQGSGSSGWLVTLLWQATFLRLVFGINEIGHANEKIFAGEASFHHMQSVFMGLGVHNSVLAGVMVIMAGLVEFGLAISVGLGLFARAGAVLGVVYFLIATVGFGGEWLNGYGWSNPGGGGWEYVMLILAYFGSVACVGAGKFSIDGWLLATGRIPRGLQWLITNASGRHTVEHG